MNLDRCAVEHNCVMLCCVVLCCGVLCCVVFDCTPIQVHTHTTGMTHVLHHNMNVTTNRTTHKGKSEVIPLQARCGPEGGQKYSSTLPWPRHQKGVSGQQHAPAAPGKDPVPILQEAGWALGPVWTGGKSRPHRDSIPDRPSRSSVTIPTELPGPQQNNTDQQYLQTKISENTTLSGGLQYPTERPYCRTRTRHHN